MFCRNEFSLGQRTISDLLLVFVFVICTYVVVNPSKSNLKTFSDSVIRELPRWPKVESDLQSDGEVSFFSENDDRKVTNVLDSYIYGLIKITDLCC